MDEMLRIVTVAVDFVCLLGTLWLGFYVVTRSPAGAVAWLASATLWAMAGYFFHGLVRHLEGTPLAVDLPWFGWSILTAVPFWYHLSVALVKRQQARQVPLAIIYLATLLLLTVQTLTPWILGERGQGSALMQNALRPGPLYPVFGALLVGAPLLALYEFFLGWRQSGSGPVRHRFAILMSATGLAAFGGLYATLSAGLQIPLPVLVSNVSLGLSVALLAYGVARYNALITGRAVGHDFVFTAVLGGAIMGAYLLTALLSAAIFRVPFLAFILFIVLAVLSHALYDWTRTYLDRRLFHHKYGELRAALRTFAHSSTPTQDLDGRLQAVLSNLCGSLRVSQGFIARQAEEGFRPVATWRMQLPQSSYPLSVFATQEITGLPTPGTHPELSDIMLIVPCHAENMQLAAIGLGTRSDGRPYGEDDLDLLEELANTVAGMILTVRLQEQTMQQLDSLMQTAQSQAEQLQQRMSQALNPAAPPPLLQETDDRSAVELVEHALRHLHDFTYLGEHPLAQLTIVTASIQTDDTDPITHLDRGRALQALLIDALEKLKPAGKPPSPPTREWHQYIILHQSYVLGSLNREIMADLYIGEGTFNRARRRAIRGLARALSELESISRLQPHTSAG